MLYKAIKSFVGVVNAKKGDVKEISNDIAKDLLRAGYVEPVKTAKEAKAEVTTEAEPTEVADVKPARRGRGKKED